MRSQIVLLIVPGHILQQDFRKHADALNVLAGFQTPVLDHRREHINHRRVGLPHLGGLLLHQRLQITAVAPQLNDIIDSALDHLRFKRLGNDIRGPHLKHLHPVVRAVLCGDHHHRRMVQNPFLPHLVQDLVAVFKRHEQIQKHDSDRIPVLSEQQQRMLSILCFQQIIIFLKKVTQNRTVDIRIICN